MLRLVDFIVKHRKESLISLAVSIILCFWLIPLLLMFERIQNLFQSDCGINLSQGFLTKSNLFNLLPIAILPLILSALVYKKLANLWIRHRNNYTLLEIPFTIVDWIALILAFLIFENAFFSDQIWQDIKVSQNLIFIHNYLLIVIVFLLFSSWYDLFGKLGNIILRRVRAISLREEKSKEEQKITQVEKDRLYFADEPIQSKSEDVLDRGSFVKGFCGEILALPSSESFVFGLYGDWGEGKSSIINLIEEELDQETRIIPIKFDPWYFENQEGLMRSFFQSIDHALNKLYFLPSFRKMLYRYKNFLLPVPKHFGVDFGRLIAPEIPEETKNRISSLINRTGKKIVLFIDDIDRLHKNEVLLIFKLIKLSANFRNVIFVVSFDPQKIDKLLSSLNGKDFLEKIVQKPVLLPKVEQSIIDNFLDQGIETLSRTLNITPDKEFQEKLPYTYQTDLVHFFPTLRTAKRYLNSLKTSLSPIYTEVNLFDFLVLELIKVFYPEVYEDIWKNAHNYCEVKWGESRLLYRDLAFDDRNRDQRIKAHIEKTVSGKKHEHILRKLLGELFPPVKRAIEGLHVSYEGDAEYYRTNKKVAHPESFVKYFMLKIPTEELSDQFIESIIDDINTCPSTELPAKLQSLFEKLQRENQSLDFLKKLRTLRDKINNQIAESLIRTLYEKISMFSKEEKGLKGSEYNSVRLIILLLIDKKIDKAQIEPLLLEIIEKSPDNEFAVQTVLSCRSERGGKFYDIYENTDINKLHQSLSKRLTTHYIEGDKDILKEPNWPFILYQWGAYNNEGREKVNEYVFSLIGEHPEYIGKLINDSFITRWDKPVSRAEIRYDDLLRVYNVDELYRLAKQKGSEAYLTPEQKEAIDLFLSVYEQRKKEKL